MHNEVMLQGYKLNEDAKCYLVPHQQLFETRSCAEVCNSGLYIMCFKRGLTPHIPNLCYTDNRHLKAPQTLWTP